MTEKELGQWVVALRSGKYIQLQKTLAGRTDPDIVEYCCLGVLAQMRNPQTAIDNLTYPKEWHTNTFTIAVVCNDNGPADQYRRVIAELEGAPEAYITE
jgi:hypothetical protein